MSESSPQSSRKLVYSLAVPADEPSLRDLLRANPMPGDISLSFETEPDFFRAAAIDGSFQQTIVGREGQGHLTGRVYGMGSRAVRPLYVNGLVADIGYLSQLRIEKRLNWGLAAARLIARAFAFIHTLHADGRTPYYLLSVVEGNHAARRFLTSGLPGMPALIEYTRMHTYTIAPRRRMNALEPPPGIQLRKGEQGDTQALAACLQRYGARHQFSPCWTEATLFDPNLVPGLRPENFWLAWRGSQVVGCLALWDQSSVKQTVVRGYGGWLGKLRGAANLFTFLTGLPYLPPPGAALRSAFASHLALDDDDPAVFNALLRCIYRDCFQSDRHYFLIGLDAANPLCPLVERYAHITYKSQLYLVAWEDGISAVKDVNRAILAAPEVAVL